MVVGVLEDVTGGVDVKGANRSFVSASILASPEIFVNSSKLVVRFIGAFGRIHFTAHTLKHCM